MLLPQLPSYWLDRHHCDTYVDIVVPCLKLHALNSSSRAKQHSITGYCSCHEDCSGLCGNIAVPTDPSSSIENIYTEPQHIVASLPCHRVLLSAASTFFAALLSPAWNEARCSASVKRIPVVLSDADDVPAMIALLKCIYTGEVNLVPSDLAAVTVTPACSSSSSSSNDSTQDYLQSHNGLTAASAAALSCSSCSCFAAVAELQGSLLSLCWQELTVRVLRLADQFSVPGGLQAAGGKLACLFSYQLSWRTVLALLWLPAAVMQQPMLKELRQMAINRVIQDMKHLDPCLASAFGRTILQHLPPDALATLLGSDQLALLSENTTLAAIDVWLAGPVASSLAAAPAPAGTSSTFGVCIG
ncbi:hypothetical protein COO60DRAFT_1188811 [Scenedesmus sp. NREL 46B-D3]|nr:hypothetical protein COO60DRAFT_1188811 [Scenedesmus sp. NREL 46B-D3]